MCDSHHLLITMDENLCVPQVFRNFGMHVNTLSEDFDFDTHMRIMDSELVKWKGIRDHMSKITFPDAESLAAFVLAWS